ncbi:LysM peptidoglycan-binding domain-containing protein [Alkalihalobacterium elongatum]|uniref:LysM peptidoglycan-binding domain-containing protein n=1 Tax=Alkalihalobacterium elongatum TaxID=2675466 RepID=UPI001C1F8634|nr:LysM peptidoglycan-binding domain-containing protein [Alkalihalobacterium elongatum]
MKKILIALVALMFLLPYQAFAHSHTLADRIIESGKRYIGTPYQFGAPLGNTSSFDCSSFTATIFGEHGITLPRVSRDQARVGVQVSLQQLQKGDLLFYDTNFDGQINHLTVYINNNEMIHASSSRGVHITNPFSNYWNDRFVTARRVIPVEQSVAPTQSSRASTYVVKSGDTLSLIARNHGVTVQQLRDWNRLTSDIIFLGQTLQVQPLNQASPSTPATNHSGAIYTVKAGDSLWTISRTYNVTVNQLMQWNNLTSSVIHVGQPLQISSTPSLKIYTVQAGDSLWGIATRNGTTVQAITELNQLQSTVIHVGQTLRLP